LKYDDAVRPSMPFDDSQSDPFVWYDFSHKQAKIYSPSTKHGSLSKGRYLPVKYTNSDARDVLSFDKETGEASLKLNLTADDSNEIPRKIIKSIPFDLESSTLDFSSLYRP
jgi:hypothetical protein